MDERRIRELADDGLEHLGTIELGAALVVGDPVRIGQTPADGAYHAGACVPGRWVLLGRAAEGDPDTLSEVVACHEDALASFWEHYDDADLVAALPVDTARVMVIEAVRKDDAPLRQEACEIDSEGLPWILDRAAVLAAEPGQPVRVFQPPGERITLLSITFGPAPRVLSGRPIEG